MPLINHENIGEVQKTAYLVGIVTAVDSEFDTVDFTGVGTCPSGSACPLFYHCQYEEGEEPALRDNGALEGAAGAFSVDDEVIVQCKITGANRYVPLRVMGFTDKPKSCCFSDPFTEADFTWAAFKFTIGDALLSYITGPTGPLDFATAFDKPAGDPYPAIFRGGGYVGYEIVDLDLPPCKYLIFKLDAVTIIRDSVGWSTQSNGTIELRFAEGGIGVSINIHEGAVPGVYYSDITLSSRGKKVTLVSISARMYTEGRDAVAIHHEVNMTFDYIKMSNEIPEGGTEIWSQIPL